jgi:hypothetical protein
MDRSLRETLMAERKTNLRSHRPGEEEFSPPEGHLFNAKTYMRGEFMQTAFARVPELTSSLWEIYQDGLRQKLVNILNDKPLSILLGPTILESEA